MSIIVACCDEYYYELRDKNKVKNIDIDELMNNLETRSTMTDNEIFNITSLYEILLFDISFPSINETNIHTLPRYINRLFLDIEKLPYTNSEQTVNNIVNDFITYIKENLKIYKYNINDDDVNIDITNIIPFDELNFDYVISHNSSSSSHIGDSYHIIFPNIHIYHSLQTKAFMSDFVNKYHQYSDYVDISIYTSRRLFRLPYSRNVSMNPRKKINKNDIHKTDFTKNEIKKYIIQYKQNEGYIIVLDRRDPINFVKRVINTQCENFSHCYSTKLMKQTIDSTKYLDFDE